MYKSVWSVRNARIIHTLAIAGPKPFHNAPTPSAAIVFLTQSTNPEYVPEGADCKRDLMTCTIQSKHAVQIVRFRSCATVTE